ncbi:MAG: hypothetical protein KF774_02270 [Planctomyces sp.]|nr:hypothetical protein [Planctomyces sp.]
MDRRKLWAAAWLAFAIYLLYRATLGAGSTYVMESDNGNWVYADPVEYVAGGAVFSPIRTLGVWIAALLTLCVLSYMYRDNPYYRFAEAVIVGVSAAYAMVVAFWSALIPNLFGELWPAFIQSWAIPGLSAEHRENWWLSFIPLVLGAMLLWRLAPRGSWIARWPLAFIVGTTAGVRLIGYIDADFVSQIRATMLPLIVRTAEAGTIDWGQSLQNTLIVFGVLSALVYFLFSVEHKGLAGRVARVGTWVLMIAFGAAFGYTVMGRIALLAIRFEFLFDDWLWLIDPLERRDGIL